MTNRGGLSVARRVSEEKKDIKRKGEGRKRNTSNTPPHRRENPGIPVRSPLTHK